MRIAGLFIAFLLGACDTQGPGLQYSALQSAVIEGIEANPVILEDGIWEGEPYVEGGSSRPRIGLVEDLIVRGDFIEPGDTPQVVIM